MTNIDRLATSAGVAAIVAGVAVALVPAPAGASDENGEAVEWPTRPLEFVVPYNPGGSTDPIGRKFAELLAQEVGMDVIVHNRPGGDETVGISSAIVDGEPDGHIMTLTSATGFIVQPLINSDLQFSGPEDWTNIVKLIEAPNSLLVRADAPWETLEDFLDAAREEPGAISIGTTGRMTRTMMTAVVLEAEADVDFTLAPYSGGAGEAIAAVLGGHTDAAVVTIPGQLGLVDAGELRALAHSGATPYERTPGSVPLEEAGYNVPFATDYFTIAPPGIPDPIRERLVAAALAVVESEEYIQWAEENGYLANTGDPDFIEEWYTDNLEMTQRAIAMIEELDAELLD